MPLYGIVKDARQVGQFRDEPVISKEKIREKLENVILYYAKSG